MIKLRKVDLPDEIVIEIEGVKFTFERPDNLDFYGFDFNDVRSQIQFVLKKLKRIEGEGFENVNKRQYRDLPIEVVSDLFQQYMVYFRKYHLSEAEEKKEQEPTSSNGTSEAV